MKQPSAWQHLRDIFLLPFTVTIIIPCIIYHEEQTFIPDYVLFKVLGVLFSLTGLVLLLWTIFLFNRIGKGTLAPWSPTQKLIVSGPYRYCRNPMITGVFFILVGETLFLHSTDILVLTCIFFIVNTIYFILKEEPDLEKRFGCDYQEYKKNVPRWVPKTKPYDVRPKK